MSENFRSRLRSVNWWKIIAIATWIVLVLANLNKSQNSTSLVSTPVESSTPTPTPSRGYASNFHICDKQVNIRQYLPEEIKEFGDMVYGKELNSSAQRYEIYPMAWTGDCSYLAFLVELVGRGSEAYNNTDYSRRGIYIFDGATEQIKLAKRLNKGAEIEDYNDYKNGLGSWWDDKYFIFTEEVEESVNLEIRRTYMYNLETNRISFYDPSKLID